MPLLQMKRRSGRLPLIPTWHMLSVTRYSCQQLALQELLLTTQCLMLERSEARMQLAHHSSGKDGDIEKPKAASFGSTFRKSPGDFGETSRHGIR